ncbi:hypothetical protein IV203_011604 [Nitzschia inconspicua]|uniref:Uncharacterized protein n=1 Tax=Nitzschia inconspicua TaxID=303405 RepID=A0A9K3KSN3_9STRA|nr:hypothetical protein IV203_011604 [Nitzschia inconspicua]
MMNIFNFFHLGHHDFTPPSTDNKTKDGKKDSDEKDRSPRVHRNLSPNQKFDRSKYLRDYGYFNKKTEVCSDRAYDHGWV